MTMKYIKFYFRHPFNIAFNTIGNLIFAALIYYLFIDTNDFKNRGVFDNSIGWVFFTLFIIAHLGLIIEAVIDWKKR